MIQISPHESPETIPREDAGAKPVPKEKPGVFARLLEGLIRNAKTGGAPEQAAGAENPGDPEELPALEGLEVLQSPEGPPEDPQDPEDMVLAGLIGFAGLAGLGGLGGLGGLENPAGSQGPMEAEPEGSAAERAPAALTEKASAETAAQRLKNRALPEEAGEASEAAGVPGEEAQRLSPEKAGEGPAEAAIAGERAPPGTESPVKPSGSYGVSIAANAAQGEGLPGRKLRGAPEIPARPASEAAPGAAKAAATAQADAAAGTDRLQSRRNEGREKRRERVSLEVRDYRQDPSPERAAEGGGGPARPGPAGSRELELRVELPREDLSGGSSPEAPEAAPARNFESLLAGELRGSLGEDILRQATLILRDGGEGLIRLALKPESLGTVKIRLEMAENKVSGRIIVESDEVLRAFEREIQSLEQAFKDSGFDGASIEMAISSGNDGDTRGQRQGTEEFFPNRELSRQAAADYDASAAQTPEGIFTWDGISGLSRRPVNMLV